MLYTLNVKMAYDDEMTIKDNDILYKLLHEMDIVSTEKILNKYDKKDFEIFHSKTNNETFYICSILEDKSLEDQIVNFIQTDVGEMLNNNNVSWCSVEYHKKDIIDYM